MAFAVEMYFDGAADTAVRHIWQSLADAGHPSPMLASTFRPHISLAVYDTDTLNLPAFQAGLVRFTEGLRPFPFQLSHIGIFATAEGVIFPGATVTPTTAGSHLPTIRQTHLPIQGHIQSNGVAMSILNQIHQHRSIRTYRPDPVPDDCLTDILHAGIRASSSGNMQTYSIIVTKERALHAQLYKPHMEQSMVLDAPVLLTFCSDFHRMRPWLRLNNAPDNFDNFMSFMIGTIDAVLVSQNVALAAESKGLGICYMGSTLANCGTGTCLSPACAR